MKGTMRGNTKARTYVRHSHFGKYSVILGVLTLCFVSAIRSCSSMVQGASGLTPKRHLVRSERSRVAAFFCPRSALSARNSFVSQFSQERKGNVLLERTLSKLQFFTLAATVNNGDKKAPSSVIVDEIRGMRVKELKEELKSYGVSIKDVFEKEELVKRLVEARQKQSSTVNSSSQGSGSRSTTTTTTPSSSSFLDVPMKFYDLEASKPVSDARDQQLFLRPSPGKYPAIDLDLGASGCLTMLVDTACSGMVLRPSSAARHGLRIVDNPISMTSAAGTGDTKLSQINRYSVQGHSRSSSFGPSPVAVQDIGALPSALDGILGLQFLNQFALVEFDFEKGILRLGDSPISSSESLETDGRTLIAEGELLYTRLGVWAVNVMFDNKGPVKLLLDTGAASTILNWKGVRDMGLTRDCPEIGLNRSPIGAMGADNVALQLTHRITLKKNVNLHDSRQSPSLEGLGLSSSLVDGGGDGPLDVDIGDLPVLDMLRADGVGGILGSDTLMRCRCVRLYLKGANTRKVVLYQ